MFSGFNPEILILFLPLSARVAALHEIDFNFIPQLSGCG
jgi:hypothetical protein